MKVICAGAPKTGTKSLAKALRMLGYENVYDFEEAIEFAFDEWCELLHDKRQDFDKLMRKTYGDVEAVVDLPHSYFFDEFLKYSPDAKVILMTRDKDAWYKSFKGMIDESAKRYWYMEYFRAISPSLRTFLGFESRLFEMTVGSHEPKKMLWQKWYQRHNAYVRATVPKDQLLEYSVKEGWEPLCKFLEKPIPDEEFPRENVALATGKNSIVDRTMQDTWIMKNCAKEIKTFFTMLTVFVVFLAYCFVF